MNVLSVFYRRLSEMRQTVLLNICCKKHLFIIRYNLHYQNTALLEITHFWFV